MAAFTNAVVQIVAQGSFLNNQFLQIQPGLDALTKPTPNRTEATLFNITNSNSQYERGTWLVATDSYNPVGVYTDILSHEQPVLWATASRQRGESSTTGTLLCGGFEDDQLQCKISPSCPFQYESGWAICDRVLGLNNNALFIYDVSVYPSGVLTNCTNVDLKIVQ